jgi:hypothetical protein
MCSSKCLAFGVPGGCRSQASLVALGQHAETKGYQAAYDDRHRDTW